MSVQARSMEVTLEVSSCCTAWLNCLTPYGPTMLLTQLIGERVRHRADHAETICRWSGSDQDFTGSHMGCWSPKARAQVHRLGISGTRWDPITGGVGRPPHHGASS